MKWTLFLLETLYLASLCLQHGNTQPPGDAQAHGERSSEMIKHHQTPGDTYHSSRCTSRSSIYTSPLCLEPTQTFPSKPPRSPNHDGFTKRLWSPGKTSNGTTDHVRSGAPPVLRLNARAIWSEPTARQKDSDGETANREAESEHTWPAMVASRRPAQANTNSAQLFSLSALQHHAQQSASERSAVVVPGMRRSTRTRSPPMSLSTTES